MRSVATHGGKSHPRFPYRESSMLEFCHGCSAHFQCARISIPRSMRSAATPGADFAEWSGQVAQRASSAHVNQYPKACGAKRRLSGKHHPRMRYRESSMSGICHGCSAHFQCARISIPRSMRSAATPGKTQAKREGRKRKYSGPLREGPAAGRAAACGAGLRSYTAWRAGDCSGRPDRVRGSCENLRQGDYFGLIQGNPRGDAPK